MDFNTIKAETVTVSFQNSKGRKMTEFKSIIYKVDNKLDQQQIYHCQQQKTEEEKYS